MQKESQDLWDHCPLEDDKENPNMVNKANYTSIDGF